MDDQSNISPASSNVTLKSKIKFIDPSQEEFNSLKEQTNYFWSNWNNGNKLFHLFSASEPSLDITLLSCGSFNPPTIMHLRMFEIARDYLHKKTDYRVVQGILSPVHDAYGKEGLISSEHRLSMLRLATKNSKWLCVDDWEAKQDGWNQILVVLKHTKGEYKKRIILLIGADLLEKFSEPDLWNKAHLEEILRDFGLIVITRFGTNLTDLIEHSDILLRYKDNIHIVIEPIMNDISSTKIRKALKEGESIRYLVPDATIDYIYEHKLYNT